MEISFSQRLADLTAVTVGSWRRRPRQPPDRTWLGLQHEFGIGLETDAAPAFDA